ncbi:hypothetical protein BD309DRAFT_987023 [Dichomitus squalens]|nr:hypothetical protein BD309DRAFT_987023 [Dichomitus squalens]
MPFLRHLSLAIHPPSAELSSALKDLLLELAPLGRIQSLRIAPSEAYISSDPELAGALTALSSLTHLEFRGAKAISCGVLDGIRSPLESVNIRLIENWERLSPDEADYDDNISRNAYDNAVDVVGHLHRFQDTLRQVELVYPLKSAPDWPALPRVELLMINYFYAPITLHYVRAFPNLVHLVVGDVIDFWGNMLHTTVHEHRECNRAQQAEYHRAWPSLRTCGGTLHALYMFALPFHIARLTIQCISRCLCGVEPAWLSAVLDDVRPSHLQLHIWPVTHLHSVWADAFRTALTVERDHPLESLHFMLRLSAADIDLKNKLLELVRGLSSLTLFSMEIICDGILEIPYFVMAAQPEDHWSRPLLGSFDPGFLFCVEDELRETDMGVVAKRFLDAVPSLKEVAIRWKGRRQLPIDVVDIRLRRRKDPVGQGEIVESEMKVLIHKEDGQGIDEEETDWESEEHEADDDDDEDYDSTSGSEDEEDNDVVPGEDCQSWSAGS